MGPTLCRPFALGLAAKVRRRYLLPGSCKAIIGKQIALVDLPIRFFRDISSRDYSHIGEYARIVFCKGFRPLKAVTHHSAQILVPSSLTCGRSAPQNREYPPLWGLSVVEPYEKCSSRIPVSVLPYC